jgi:hypothetical protein
MQAILTAGADERPFAAGFEHHIVKPAEPFTAPLNSHRAKAEVVRVTLRKRRAFGPVIPF